MRVTGLEYCMKIYDFVSSDQIEQQIMREYSTSHVSY